MEEKKLTKNGLNKMFVRSWFLVGSFNFERMQSIGFCVTLIPAIKRLYSKVTTALTDLPLHETA